MANALKQAFGPLPEATGKVKELADKITLLVDKLAALFGIDFSSFKSSTQDAATTAGGAWDMYGERAAAAEATVKTSTDSTAANMIAFVGVLNDLVDGNWAALWEKYKAYAMDAYSATDTDTAQNSPTCKRLLPCFMRLWPAIGQHFGRRSQLPLAQQQAAFRQVGALGLLTYPRRWGNG